MILPLLEQAGRRHIDVQVLLVRDGEAALAEGHIPAMNLPKLGWLNGDLSVVLVEHIQNQNRLMGLTIEGGPKHMVAGKKTFSIGQ